MVRKFSESTYSSSTLRQQVGNKKPRVYIVSSDKKFLQQVLAECSEIPPDYKLLSSIPDLMDDLSRLEKLSLAFILVVERQGISVDAAALRSCKLNYPQLFFVVMLEACEQRTLLRLQSLGVQNILLPPFSDVSLSREIATALPNVPQFKRHPELLRRGQVRLDFLLPDDLSYVLGMNYLLSLLLKEFAFPVVDSRVNIPLACDEAITNAMVHGNKNDPEKKVEVQIYISYSRFKMRVRDQGDGFDTSSLRNPTEGENLLRSSGRGIFLMKSIMDSVEFKDGGRIVELEKRNLNAKSD
jgi:anti-sigma regulatory factor (Ser/Thr protein kinase)